MSAMVIAGTTRTVATFSLARAGQGHHPHRMLALSQRTVIVCRGMANSVYARTSTW